MKPDWRPGLLESGFGCAPVLAITRTMMTMGVAGLVKIPGMVGEMDSVEVAN